MARIIAGPLVTSISGKAGEVVFAELLGTPYVRTKQKPYVSNTLSQQLERLLFKNVAHNIKRGGWTKESTFGTICLRQNRYPHAVLLSAILRTRKTFISRSLFDHANGLPDFTSYSISPQVGFVTVQVNANPMPFDLRLNGIAIDDDYRVQSTFTNAYLSGQPGTLFFDIPQTQPITFAFFTSHPTNPDFWPDDPKLWNIGVCATLP